MTNQITPIPSPHAPDDIDENGYNLADYHWVPVLKKPRKDGWSPAKQRAFIEALADTGSVATAAQSVGMTDRGAQMLRRSPGAESFDRAWMAAINAASTKLMDEAFERALVGSDEPVFDREGNRVGRRFKKSDKMLQFLLRGYFPERFGHFANHDPAHAAVSPPVAVAEALEHLVPPAPADPHLLMPPEDLDSALQVADILDGKLPHYYRDPQPPSPPRLAPEVEQLRDNARSFPAMPEMDVVAGDDEAFLDDFLDDDV